MILTFPGGRLRTKANFSRVSLEFQIVSYESVSVLRCRGKLTYGPETNELISTARQVLETTKEVVLQMAEVTQIDSGGIGALGSVLISARNRDAEVKLATLHQELPKSYASPGSSFCSTYTRPKPKPSLYS